jgi:hypothetical protein
MQVHGTVSQFRSGATHLREYPWPFTTVDSSALTPVYILATVNFFGSWWLYYEQSKLFVLHAFSPLIMALTIYGTAFAVVPLIRFFVIQLLNKRVETRNSKRQEYAVAVQNQPAELAAKLKEAANYRIGETYVSANNLAYSTEKNALEQKDALDQTFEKLEDGAKTVPVVQQAPVVQNAQPTRRFHSAKPAESGEHLNISDRQSGSSPDHIINLTEKERVEQEQREQNDSNRTQFLSD